jgi:hypothetical protein
MASITRITDYVILDSKGKRLISGSKPVLRIHGEDGSVRIIDEETGQDVVRPYHPEQVT